MFHTDKETELAMAKRASKVKKRAPVTPNTKKDTSKPTLPIREPSNAGTSKLPSEEGPYVTVLWDILNKVRQKQLEDEVGAFVGPKFLHSAYFDSGLACTCAEAGPQGVRSREKARCL
jgi:hypothetical protein